MNKKRIWFLTAVSVLLLGLVGCPSETAGSQTSVGTTQTTNGNGGQTPPTVPNDNTKITSLQIAINEANVGDSIDFTLDKYSGITEFGNVNVNKAVTIANFNDMKSAILQVSSDGVVLNGIQKASVTTNSSLKISGSSLSCLSIASAVSSTPSANQIVSRGEMGSSAQPPVVEVTNTEVAEEVSVGIANAYLNVKQFTAKKAIELGAANVQLTINDKATNIKEIKTDKICQVILEDGTSDTIPCSLNKISVTGSGELKQIDMTVKDGKRLIALTPVGGLTTAIQKDESIDFSTAVVLGTYQQTDGVAVFTAAGLSYNFTETFSKLEKDFIVKINEVADDDGLPTVPLYRGGENQVYDWSSLSAGKHKAVIELVWDNRAEDYAYNFVITVIDGAAMPTFTLTAIEANAANVKTQYKAGEPLNLTGLIVEGTYKATVGDISYKGIVADYTLTPPNGTILTADMDAVKVSVGTFTRTLPITVKSVLNVTFVIDAADEQNGTIVQTVLQGDKVSEQTPRGKQGYTFGGWYLKTGDSIADLTYDFGTIVSENITLVAKWTPNVYTVTLNLNYVGSASTTIIDATFDCKLSDIDPPTRTGYEFQGYNAAIDGTGIWYYNINGEGGVWKIADNATLYAHWTPKQYAVSLMDGDQECSSITAIYNQNLSVASNKIPTKTGYAFNGFWSAPDGGVQYIDATGDGVTPWTASNDVSYDVDQNCYNLYAQWTAVWTTDASGDFVCGSKTYKKTALIPVMNNAIKINGSGTEGVFVNGRTVTLSPYAIGKYEVTQELYRAVMGNNPSSFTVANAALDTSNGETTDDLRPVENIGWYDAIIFCNKLSILMDKIPCYKLKNGNSPENNASAIPTTDEQNANSSNWYNMICDWTADGYRLPTECEWEFAARGGDPSDTAWNLTYAGSNTIDDVAWFGNNGSNGNSAAHTWEVGLKPSNKIGLYDMTGNVWEWCWDYSVDAAITDSTLTTGPGTGNLSEQLRRVRGGAWTTIENNCKVNHRSDGPSYLRDNYRGLRLVQNIPQDLSLSANRIAANGNFVINNIEYKKTALKKVMDNDVTVEGSDANWNGYATEHTSFKGVFIEGRTVHLDPYRIGQYEVTQELFTAVMNYNPSYFNASKQSLREIETDVGLRPVEEVNWYDAITFCNKLSLLMGKTRCYDVGNMSDIDWANLAYENIPDSLEDATSDWNNASVNMNANGYRLPTECEWEFAARGGEQDEDDWSFAFSGIDVAQGHMVFNNDNYLIENDANLAQVGWYPGNSTSTYQVGLKKSNRLGLYDMSGNVREWCWDWYGCPITTETPTTGISSGRARVMRGGSWGGYTGDKAFICSVSYCFDRLHPCRRDCSLAETASPGVNSCFGFRLVQTVTE